MLPFYMLDSSVQRQDFSILIRQAHIKLGLKFCDFPLSMQHKKLDFLNTSTLLKFSYFTMRITIEDIYTEITTQWVPCSLLCESAYFQ